MVELSLVPDVKQQLIKARRVRNLVISISVIVGIVSVGVVIALAMYLYGVQTVRNTVVDNSIKDKSKELSNIKDLNDMLTVQNQLQNISALHDSKNIDSRFFDIIDVINPPESSPNRVIFTTTRIDSAESKIILEAKSSVGFQAAEVLKKTIEETTVRYKDKGEIVTEKLASNVVIAEMNYGDDADGQKVLNFTISFEYPTFLFTRSSQDLSFERPGLQNATDSYRRVPESLFGNKAGSTTSQGDSD